MSINRTWPPALFHLPEEQWTLDDDQPRLRIRVDGYTLEVAGMAVTFEDGVQTAADSPELEEALLGIYDPGARWQTFRGFGREFVLYGMPAKDQGGPVAAEVRIEGTPDPWLGFAPEYAERNRRLLSVVVLGHCALFIEARRVTSGPEQRFIEDDDERSSLEKLAGWAGPYPTLRFPGSDDEYVLLMYPHSG